MSDLSASVNAGPVAGKVPFYVEDKKGRKTKKFDQVEAEVLVYGYKMPSGDGVYCNIQIKLADTNSRKVLAVPQKSLMAVSLSAVEAAPYLEVVNVKPEQCGLGFMLYTLMPKQTGGRSIKR